MTHGQMNIDSEFLKVIQGRRSVRRYQERSIEPLKLKKILKAAIWAPSAHNRQPWRFCVVTNRTTKEQLSAEMSARWRADLTSDQANPELIERRIAISHSRLTRAGALIIASVTMEDMDEYPDNARNQAEWTMAVQSVALACQNLLLAAHQQGLAACWMCAPLFVPALVRNVLDLPRNWTPQALITIGYPMVGHTAADKVKERKPLNDCVIWR